MEVGSMRAAVTAMRAAYDAVAALPIEALTAAELLDALDQLETLTCQLPVQGHRLLTRLQAETTPRAMGAKSWRDVLAVRWRISPGEAARRLDEAAMIGPRQGLSGTPMEPVLASTAIAQSHGLINREHVRILRDAMGRIPPAIDPTTRGQIEADLVRTAMGVGPKELKDPRFSMRGVRARQPLGGPRRLDHPDRSTNDVEWIPPPHLDTGQARVNDHHRPERLHRPPDDQGVAREPGGPEPNAA